MFGWVPVMLWVLIGGIFFGGVHDYGALFASIRHKGESIGEVIGDAIGAKAKKLFITFAYLTLILVVAAFASIVANTFKATYTADGLVDLEASAANASTAIISIMFIVMAILFGFFVYRRNAPLGIATVIGVIGIVVCMVIGLNWHPIYLSYTVWMIIVGLYIGVASVTPVWILLQPRDYLSSFLLYGMMILAVVGIIGCHPDLDMPAFTGFYDTHLSGLSVPRTVRDHRLRRCVRLPLSGGLRHDVQAAGSGEGRQAHRLRWYADRVRPGADLRLRCGLHLDLLC